MSNFLSNYEDVNSRIERFKQLYPKGSILTFKEFFEPENGWVLFRCEIRKDAQSTMPDASDFAFGDRNLYPKNIQRFFCEDTATSAQGRALNSVIPTNGKKPTAQDMAKTIKVEDVNDPWAIVEKPAPTQMPLDQIAAELQAEEIPQCKHGAMILKEGNKNNRAFHGYVCRIGNMGSSTDACPPIWYDLMPSGKWAKPKPKAGK